MIKIKTYYTEKTFLAIVYWIVVDLFVQSDRNYISLTRWAIPPTLKQNDLERTRRR
jgi:hypothetical protein